MTRFSLSGFVCWFGVVIKPESASRFDEFAVHSRVGAFQRGLPGFDIDSLLIVERDIRLVELTGARYHFGQISTRASMAAMGDTS